MHRSMTFWAISGMLILLAAIMSRAADAPTRSMRSAVFRTSSRAISISENDLAISSLTDWCWLKDRPKV